MLSLPHEIDFARQRKLPHQREQTNAREVQIEAWRSPTMSRGGGCNAVALTQRIMPSEPLGNAPRLSLARVTRRETGTGGNLLSAPTHVARQAPRPTSQSRSRYGRHHRFRAREPRDPSSIRSREGCGSFAGEGARPASRMSGIKGPLGAAPKNREMAWANNGLPRAFFRDGERPEA
jgi:hypothetical protein